VQVKVQTPILALILLLILVSMACGALQSASITTPEPIATPTATQTPRPSPTLRPTRTPDLAATQQVEELNAEVQSYYGRGYLTTTEGQFTQFDDFRYELAKVRWYPLIPLRDLDSDFYMKAHFKWSNADRSADISGCGFVFAIQDDQEHYGVFLDRSRIYFVQGGYFYNSIGPINGSGLVDFDNPFDHPVEADFTLIVREAQAYVLVDDELVGEYALLPDKLSGGKVGLSTFSGTNKDYGTRCEMTNLHLWIPDE